MFCSRCGKPVPDAAAFCPSCGARVDPGTGTPPPTTPPSGAPAYQFAVSAPSSRLATLEQLVMLHSNVRSVLSRGTGGPGKMRADGIGQWRAFRFEDPSGGFAGEATSEPTYPARYLLVDENRSPVLVLDSVGTGGPMLGRNKDPFLIHDGGGSVLASLEMQTASWARERGVTVSSWGRHYGVTVGGKEAMLAVSNPANSLAQLIELGRGTVLASSVGKHGFATARSQIDFPEPTSVDHRIALGAFLMLSYTVEGYR